jgi:hypothetical protein
MYRKHGFSKPEPAGQKPAVPVIAGYGKNRQVTVSGSGFVPALAIARCLK